MVCVQLSTSMQMYNQWSLVLSVMQYKHVSQFLRLGCVLYVTALEAYWCTEASAALLLSLLMAFRLLEGSLSILCGVLVW